MQPAGSEAIIPSLTVRAPTVSPAVKPQDPASIVNIRDGVPQSNTVQQSGHQIRRIGNAKSVARRAT